MKYVLEGSIVSFNPKREVIRDGYLVVDGEKIVYVAHLKKNYLRTLMILL